MEKGFQIIQTLDSVSVNDEEDKELEKRDKLKLYG